MMSKPKGTVAVPEESQNLSFEEALKRLEDIVESMEAQDLPLESLLTRYEEGTKLSSLCQLRLSEAEVKLQQLEKNSKGEISLKPSPITEAL